MEIDDRVGAIEDAVLEPVRLPVSQDVAGRFQVRDVGGFVRRIGYDQHHVDLRFGGQSRH